MVTENLSKTLTSEDSKENFYSFFDKAKDKGKEEISRIAGFITCDSVFKVLFLKL